MSQKKMSGMLICLVLSVLIVGCEMKTVAESEPEPANESLNYFIRNPLLMEEIDTIIESDPQVMDSCHYLDIGLKILGLSSHFFKVKVEHKDDFGGKNPMIMLNHKGVDILISVFGISNIIKTRIPRRFGENCQHYSCNSHFENIFLIKNDSLSYFGG